MAVWREKGKRTYRYTFRYRGRRYKGNTGQLTKTDALEWERAERRRVARVTGGLERTDIQSFLLQEWADVYLAHKRRQPNVKRADLLARTVPMVLEFFGVAPPGVTPSADKPYHGLTLADLIEKPEYVEAFEEWMRTRRRRLPRRSTDRVDAPPRLGGLISGSQRNSFRSVMSGFYRVALLPRYRQHTGVTMNPFAHVPRDRRRRRRLHLTLSHLRAWVEAAAPHVQLALAIGALAPTLRMSSILKLRWHRDGDWDAVATVSKDWALIRVDEHKTDADGEPVVVPIVGQLKQVIELAWIARTDRVRQQEVFSGYVIHYRGRGVKSIKTGLRRAAERAAIPYGLASGTTFHTLRHFAATLLAERHVPEAQRKAALGHGDLATTQIYTHLSGIQLEEPLTVLSNAAPLADLLREPPPAPGPGAGRVQSGGTSSTRDEKDSAKIAQFRWRAKTA